MSCADIADLVAKLRTLRNSYTNVLSLLAPSGDAVQVRLDAVRQCPYFERLFAEQPGLEVYRANFSRETFTAFAEFVEGRHCNELQDAFGAIVFGRQIEWPDFVRCSCEAAADIEAPLNPNADNVSFVVQALVKYLPTRVFEYYEGLLKKLTGRLSPGETYQIIGDVIEAIDRKKGEVVAPLPIPLFEKRITVALMRDSDGKSVITVLHEQTWLPFNIFGPNFCPFMEGVRHFHLVFGRYVVYERSDGHVLMRSIRSGNEPSRVLFTSCQFFRSRCNQLHVISVDESSQTDCLYEWDPEAMSFAKKFSHPTESLRAAHRGADEQLRIVLANGKVVTLAPGDSATSTSTTGPSSPTSEGVTHSDANCADLIEDCCRHVGNARYCAAGRISLSGHVHVGYNRASVNHYGKDFYVTNFYSVDWHMSGQSQLHGVVSTLTDVLIL